MLSYLTWWRRVTSIFFVVAPALFLSTIVVAQSTNLPIEISALSATFGTLRPQMVTLTGHVKIFSGASPEEGAVKLITDSNGASRAYFTLPSEEISEEQWDDGANRQCKTIVKETPDTRLTPNCWLSVPWFLPQMSFLGSSGNLARQDLGVLDEDGAPRRVVVSRKSAIGKFHKQSDADAIPNWSQTRMRLDPGTLLPDSLTYTMMANNRVNATVKVKVDFSDYRIESGIQIPHRIRRYFNNSLQGDIQIETVTIK